MSPGSMEPRMQETKVEVSHNCSMLLKIPHSSLLYNQSPLEPPFKKFRLQVRWTLLEAVRPKAFCKSRVSLDSRYGTTITAA